MTSFEPQFNAATPVTAIHSGFEPYVAAAKPHAAISPLDGYSLVLLAQQELSDGRSPQAEALIEAAFLAYDMADISLSIAASVRCEEEDQVDVQ